MVIDEKSGLSLFWGVVDRFFFSKILFHCNVSKELSPICVSKVLNLQKKSISVFIDLFFKWLFLKRKEHVKC